MGDWNHLPKQADGVVAAAVAVAVGTVLLEIVHIYVPTGPTPHELVDLTRVKQPQPAGWDDLHHAEGAHTKDSIDRLHRGTPHQTHHMNSPGLRSMV